MPTMSSYDLCLAWYWPFDHDFVCYVEEACQARGLTLWQITPANLLPAISELYTGKVAFATFLDRTTDDLRFEPIRRFALHNHLRRINPPELSHWSEDKATMHLELIQAGLQTPYTILIAPFVDQPLLPDLDLSPLGPNFVIKPAAGGGGEGVRLNGRTAEDIQCARLDFPNQKYLVQEHIPACLIADREAWFRIFYVGGEAIPCWWNPATHIYAAVTSEESQQYGLEPLWSLTERIARVCKLDWFSTEIALAPDGRFVIVDYVNDGIDTRIQSKASDGVPDEILKRIAERLAGMAIRPPE